ncbi:MAG: DUF488 domain-containing protein [Pseudomonas oryzihabitans]
MILTLGHSNHPLARYVELLKAQGVTAVADVRSQPYSRHVPQYRREALREGLAAAGIAYVFLGAELGARSPEPAHYEQGRVRYDRLAASAPFQRGLVRLEQGQAHWRIALLCAERDPLTCHRGLLVAPCLVRRGLAVRHIHPDGRLESQVELEDRLLAASGLADGDLFSSREERLKQAYARHGWG